ncbi:hypothetical protein CF327_g1663 [Tilletia walkeri]|uniref:DNL-type domain-containing protein n=1 Tax=Tilletia walkeri TaxID=117179 RepID=A0A8X7T731_9BASI|nr:hypothetical protein CF327_g1663 [Tilletia walkeri]KAE8271347.1 hypothetical protein A4X09_0g1026 [Tilletia walkeri]
MSRLASFEGLRVLRQVAAQAHKASSSGYAAASSRTFSRLPGQCTGTHPLASLHKANSPYKPRYFSYAAISRREAAQDSAPAPPATTSDKSSSPGSSSQPIGEIKPRLSLTFTCTVTDCGHRSTHEFSKQAYTRGIVLVKCPGCNNRHLIADHLGWFTETAGEPRTVEEMVRAKGGEVKRGFKYSDGQGGHAIEIEPDEGSDSGSSSPPDSR